MSGPTVEWTIAAQFGSMSDYGIPPAPINVDENGKEFISADNPMTVKR